MSLTCIVLHACVRLLQGVQDRTLSCDTVKTSSPTAICTEKSYLGHISTLQITLSAFVSFHFLLIRPSLLHVRACERVEEFFTTWNMCRLHLGRHEPRWCTEPPSLTVRWAELAQRDSCSLRWVAAERGRVWLRWRAECWYLQTCRQGLFDLKNAENTLKLNFKHVSERDMCDMTRPEK